jgi:hypothetical protein
MFWDRTMDMETHGIDRGDLSYKPIDYMIEICRLHHK